MPNRSALRQPSGLVSSRGSLRATAALLLLLVLLAGCQSAPMTGRSQFLAFSPSTENQIGQQAWDETLAEASQKGTLVSSGSQAERVQRVGAAIAEAALRHPDTARIAEGYSWDFVLLRDDQVNAWALPGGHSAVYTGLFTVVQNDDELAVVLGHEVAHALARHSGERMTQGVFVNLGLTVAQVLSGDMDSQSREVLMQSLGIVGQAGVILPFSRQHESEADHIGLLLAADAGYDPRAAITLWTRMGERGGERPPEILSTHPSEATRIERLEELMPQALEIYERSSQTSP